MNTEPTVMLSLTYDQALVLFDWLTREDTNNHIPFAHQAEQTVLWKLEGQLEKILVEPLQADYEAAISAARERVVS